MIKLARAASALLSLVAVDAVAETQVTGTRSTPIATSTANNGAPDDVRVVNGATLQTSGSGAAATLDSSNLVTNEGTIKILDANDAVGILARGGNTGGVTNNGTISITDSTEATTIPLTAGVRRFGVVITGPQPFSGYLVQGGAGSTSVRGNDSAAFLVDTRLDGYISLAGGTTIKGDNSYGLRTRGVVEGDVTISGTIAAVGVNTGAASFENSILGKLTISNVITATGYLNVARPTDAAAFAALGPNDMLQGGPAVRVAGDVGGGILVDTAGAITSYGSAPSLLIGGSGNTHIGVAGTDADNAALLLRGTLAADGVYNNVTATALQIGGQGGTVTLDGGIRNTGNVRANAYATDATALRAAAGAVLPVLRNEGAIGATVTAESPVASTAVRIEQGATLSAIANSGTIAASVSGSEGTHTPVAGTATAILDLSGSLVSITNQGTIAANLTPGTAGEAVAGSRIAMDLRANTAGVTVTQSAVSGATTVPSIVGDVLFGSGNARLELLAGSLKGAVAFGNGNDSLLIDGGATLQGAVTDSDGRVSVQIANGRLTQASFTNLNVSSLTIGAQGQLVLPVDPVTGRVGSLTSSGAITFEQGARLGFDFQSKLTAPLAAMLITAPSSQLIGQVALGDVPYFYNASLTQDSAAGTIGLNVRRRTAAEAGITVGAAAYDAIFAAHDRDLQLGQAFSRATTQASFQQLYNRMLPDYSGGSFQTLVQGMNALTRAQGEDPLRLRASRNGFWAQPYGFGSTRERDSAPGWHGGGYGLAVGWETPNSSIGTWGVSVATTRSWIDTKDTDPDDRTKANTYLLGAYWQDRFGGVLATASVNGGYVNQGTTRKLTSTDVNNTSFTRNAEARWGGLIGDARLALSYVAALSDALYVRPKVAASYLVLQEGAHSERGGGDGFDLSIASRNSTQASAEGTVTLGYALGSGPFQWRPEVEVGYRQIFGGGAASTTAQFVSGGTSFVLDPQKLQGGGLLTRVAVRGGDSVADIGLELGGEERGNYRAYDGRFIARMRF
jgi:Autotransporter beta-domain